MLKTLLELYQSLKFETSQDESIKYVKDIVRCTLTYYEHVADSEDIIFLTEFRKYLVEYSKCDFSDEFKTFLQDSITKFDVIINESDSYDAGVKEIEYAIYQKLRRSLKKVLSAGSGRVCNRFS